MLAIRAFLYCRNPITRIVAAFSFSILLCLAGSATADDSKPLMAAEKDLLGVWVLKLSGQNALYQIFCPDRSFAQVAPPDGRRPGSPPFQTGKWSVDKNVVNLDEDNAGSHSSQKYSILPGNPPTLTMLQGGMVSGIAFVFERQDVPEKVTEEALNGDWSILDGSGVTGVWTLKKTNDYSFSAAADGYKFAESGQWHLNGNQLKLADVKSDPPGSGDFGEGTIVLLTADWLLIREKAGVKNYLDVFHHGALPDSPVAGRAGRTRTIADLYSIKTALNMFYVENSRFPTTDEGLQALVTNPGNLEHWQKTMEGLPKDPWGHAYIYRCPGSDGQDFDLLSAGPDGKEGTADDVQVR
jgi:type II secretion system protein G